MTQPEVIGKLQRALVGGELYLLEQIPATLARVIEQKIWQKCVDEQGAPFKTFETFAAYPLYCGLERSIDDLLALCRKRPEIQELIKTEIGGLANVGRPKGNVDNINNTTGGTGSTYTLKRLKRDAPELAQRVSAGKLSAHAAAIEAGFRHKSITIPRTVQGAAKALMRHFSRAELAVIVASLTEVG